MVAKPYVTNRLFLFLQIVFFLCITPGTPRVVIVTYAINYGLRRSTITALGDISANTIQMIFIAFGIGAIIAAHPEILVYAKWVAVFYLLYLAYDLKKSSKNLVLKRIYLQKVTFHCIEMVLWLPFLVQRHGPFLEQCFLNF
jgi:threonine/homoserine/homoserine lactone efflux protein